MTENKKSPIKLSDIVSNLNDFNVMSSFIVNPTTGESVEYNRYFNKNEIEKLMIELFEDMQYTIEKGYDFFKTEEQIIKYELLLIIKYFSHFKNEIGNSFEEKIVALDALSTVGLYDLFFDEIFDKDEVAYVIERVNTVVEKTMLAQEAIEREIVKDERLKELQVVNTLKNAKPEVKKNEKPARKPRAKKAESKDKSE